MKPKVGSLFAGIGGFDLGFERAGFEVAWCVEICPRARAVLARHFPNARLYSDIREIDGSELAPVDVVCGGFPCQDLSTAGKRAGLAGERSGLFHDAMRIVRRVRPRAVVVENVAGLLSSNRGHDFATVLREMGEGWDCSEIAWRVLDSRYFGVAQRRRRVFIVAASGTGTECAAQILSLNEGSARNRATSKKPREETASAFFTCAGNDAESATVGTLCGELAHTLTANGSDASEDGTGRGTTIAAITEQFCDVYNHTLNGEVSPTLTSQSGQGSTSGPKVISFKTANSARARSDALSFDIVPTLGTSDGSNVPAILEKIAIRRLMPVETERLQGFPDGWTSVADGKTVADSHRYKQTGNAVTVNVAEWIARRMHRAMFTANG